MESLTSSWFRPVAGALGLALFLSAAATINAQQPDPSVRAVRLSYVDGRVQLSQGNQIQADPALANTPLFEGNLLTTGEDGRAEVQFDDGSVVRISPNSTLMIGVLRQQGGTQVAELVLQSGLGYFELQGDSATSHITVRFADCVVNASGFTVVRLNVDNPPGEVAVFSGNAHLSRSNALSLDMHGGESVSLDVANASSYNLAETIQPDSWDAWNSDRDQDISAQEAARTPATTNVENSNNPAWSDLDANGNWYSVPGQGYIWSPYEAAGAGFDPYGCGSWEFTPRFGYMWVSCYSWGYMPFEFGSWNYYDGFGWGWMGGGNPWWWGGGWASNVGNGPRNYEPPHRPRGGPVRPPSGGSPTHGGIQPYPVVPVRRVPGNPTANPVRVGNGPVMIGGNPVQPLRPVSARPVYGSGVRPIAPNQGGGNIGHPGYSVWPNNAGETHTGPGVMPAPSSGSTYHPSSAPSRAPSYGGGGSRPSSGGGYHPSSGGGGGGSHPSSGGGGGGSHPSGGGGGGGSHASGGGGGSHH